MGHISDGETRSILRRLGILIPAFYALYYTVSVILVGAFGLQWISLATLPFRFTDSQFGFSAMSMGFGSLAAWLAMVVSFVCGALLVFVIVRSTKRAWDYAVTLAFLHIIVCCIVGLDFPVNWVWWVTLVGGTFVMSTVSELLCYFLIDLREIRLDH